MIEVSHHQAHRMLVLEARLLKESAISAQQLAEDCHITLSTGRKIIRQYMALFPQCMYEDKSKYYRTNRFDSPLWTYHAEMLTGRRSPGALAKEYIEHLDALVSYDTITANHLNRAGQS